MIPSVKLSSNTFLASLYSKIEEIDITFSLISHSFCIDSLYGSVYKKSKNANKYWKSIPVSVWKAVKNFLRYSSFIVGSSKTSKLFSCILDKWALFFSKNSFPVSIWIL